MKKFISLAIGLSIAATIFCGCNTKDVVVVSSEDTKTTSSSVSEEHSQENVQVQNPWIETQDINEANQKAGTEITIPDGLTPSIFRYIEDDCLDIVFSEGYIVRVAKTDSAEDISGDYNEYSQVTGSVISLVDITQYSNSLEFLNTATWYSDGYSYAFVSDHDMNRNDAMNIIEAFIVANTMLF